MSQLFASGGQNIGVSVSTSVLPVNTQDWFLKSLLQHHSSKASILRCSAFFTVQLSHPCMTTGKTIALTRRTFVGKVMSLLSIVLVYLHARSAASVLSDSLQPYGLSPARLFRPWGSPGKNTGVSCHAFLRDNLPGLGIKPLSLISPAMAGP